MYEELGSDGNYYSASMELGSDDTLRIMVGSSGAGNEQKWVREGEYIPGQGGSGGTETLSGRISDPRTLKNGEAAVDYFIENVLDVTAPLIIEPGVVIEMAQNAGIGVYDNGSLKIMGTASEPVLITGSQHQRGWWRGIHIETTSSENMLQNVRIEDAGSNYVYCCNEVATLFLKAAKLSMVNVELANGAGFGLMALRGTTFDNYENVQIEKHSEYPVWIYPEVLTFLDGNGSDYTGNDKDLIYVPEGDVATATTWKAANVGYLIEGGVMDITEPLTIEAGTELVFEESGGLGVYDGGSLSVNGTTSDPVVMRGSEPTRGFWRGIHMETNFQANSLNYLELSNAGSNYVYCCNDKASILFKAGQAAMRNCTLSDGAGYGVIAKSNFRFSAYESNTITSHKLEPMLVPMSRLAEMDGLKSTYLGNDIDYIAVSDDNVDEETTIPPSDVPYKIELNKVIDVTARLNILAGAEFAFSENSGLGVYDNGILNAIGTEADMVVMRGLDNIKGYWRGIHTETNSNSNFLSYVEIRDAGSNYVYCCNPIAALMVKGGLMKVENCRIIDNGGCGIFVNASATLQESKNQITGNTDGAICN